MRLLPAFGLLLFAPITAEYLYGYDESTGDLAELIGGLVVFAPLYGGAALLIREAARRTGRGWPTILLLGLAFGVVQAGLIDNSMFNPSYRDIAYWDEMFRSSYVPALGFNPNLALAFSVGHMVWSVGAPIAVVEALTRRTTTPWLGRFGLALTTVAFLLGAGFVVWWHQDTEHYLPSGWQLAGAAVVAGALIVAAFAIRPRPAESSRPPVSPWLAGAVTFAVFILPLAVDLLVDAGFWQPAEASWFLQGWSGFAVNIALLAGLAMFLARRSARPVAVAGGALLANVATAFAAEPIGDVDPVAKYAHNTVAVLLVATLLAAAAYRARDRSVPG